MCNPSRDRRADGGFTLVELLVVIGIIALLISILLPSLSKARVASEKVVCQSNLRQLYLGALIYQNANHDYIPCSGWDLTDAFGAIPVDQNSECFWYNGIPRALGMKVYGYSQQQRSLDVPGTIPPADTALNRNFGSSIMACPTARGIHDQRCTYAENYFLRQNAMYAWMSGFGSIPQAKMWDQSIVDSAIPLKLKFFYGLHYTNPSIVNDWRHVPYLMDGYWTTDAVGGFTYDCTRFQQAAFNGSLTGQQVANDRLISNPHDQAMNVLFLDGHVESQSHKGNNPDRLLRSKNGGWGSADGGPNTQGIFVW